MEHINSDIIFYGEFAENVFNKFEKDYLKYKLTFKNVIYYKCYELDIYPNENLLESSFNLVNDSELIKVLKEKNKQNKIKDGHKHYVLATYDDVFEIITTEYILIIYNKK